jgi:hypothetical protein
MKLMETMMSQVVNLITLDYVTATGPLVESLLATSINDSFDLTQAVCQLMMLLGGMRSVVSLVPDQMIKANAADAVRLLTVVKAVDDLLSNALYDITMRK